MGYPPISPQGVFSSLDQGQTNFQLAVAKSRAEETYANAARIVREQEAAQKAEDEAKAAKLAQIKINSSPISNIGASALTLSPILILEGIVLLILVLRR